MKAFLCLPQCIPARACMFVDVHTCVSVRMYTGTQHTVTLWKMPGSLREMKSFCRGWLVVQSVSHSLVRALYPRETRQPSLWDIHEIRHGRDPELCSCRALHVSDGLPGFPACVCERGNSPGSKWLDILKMWLTSLKLTLPDSSLLSGQRPSDQAAARPSLAPAAHPRQQHPPRSRGTSSSSRGVDPLLPSLPCGSCSHLGGGEELGRVSCSTWFFAL